MKEYITQIASDFFSHLGTHTETISIEEQEPGIFYIHVQSDDSKLLIGPRGRNLSDMQHLLKTMIQSKQDSRVKIHLEVNDYMASKDTKLHHFLDKKIAQARESGAEVILPFFSGYERKKIHSYVASLGDDSIHTESQGEGKERRMHLSVSGPKLSIDIDGDDI
ncbi:hypothetical protein MK079_03255 [Candidatus Gracilibacteria bacterium]|nr:hypothetical protein [Candidatus Gracilibacteria bacterium]